MKMLALTLGLAAAQLVPVAAYAQDNTASLSGLDEQTVLQTRAEQVVGAINGDIPFDQLFAQSFFADVPEEQLVAIVQSLTDQFGAALAVEELASPESESSVIAIRMERAIARGIVAIDPADGNRISQLLFQSFDPVDDSREKIERDLAALPGSVNAYFGPLDGGPPLLSIGADEKLALGSTFKLFVLATLAHAVERGEMTWDDIHRLERKSFPSGQMQAWPLGSPVTKHTLATMMISISDNTATDQLLALLPKNAVAREVELAVSGVEPRNAPWLDTLTLFALKGDPQLAAAFVAGDEAEQAALVVRLAAQAGGDPAKITPPRFTEPTAIETIEWFASPADLRRLLALIADLRDPTARQIMAINPSIPPTKLAKWQYVGFKGGSEPGVINLTWLLQDRDGRWHILTMGWNDPAAPVDETAFELLAQRVIALAR